MNGVTRFNAPLTSSTDMHATEIRGGLKPSTCRPMKPSREKLAYANLDNGKGPAISANELKSRKGTCKQCSVHYRWQGFPLLRKALCCECSSPLEETRTYGKDLPTYDRKPLQAKNVDRSDGACLKCKIIYIWDGAPIRRNAICPTCGSHLARVTLKREDESKIMMCKPQVRSK